MKVFIFIGFLLILPLSTGARVGVGMGQGEIRLTEPTKPGGIYALPSLRIFNTGDETATYGMGVAYHQENPELRPRREWFIFKPETFILEPQQSQEVAITMLVPVKAEPGDYFAFLESGPVPSNEPGTTVGIAVATKLFFTMVPANLFQAINYRIVSFFKIYSPWPQIGLGVLAAVILLFLFRKFFSLNISRRR
ncbi:MAG: hypothetical protein HY481_00515 [Candidatus Vogelbacteria bacterium]|nr:hypothetical protein [Candidatus Vogelbacteria bacterium]